jgi:hypothetical protein
MIWTQQSKDSFACRVKFFVHQVMVTNDVVFSKMFVCSTLNQLLVIALLHDSGNEYQHCHKINRLRSTFSFIVGAAHPMKL